MRNGREFSDRSIGKGLIAGFIGGLFASWMMDQYQAGVQKVAQSWRDNDPRRPSDESDKGQAKSNNGSRGQNEDPTMKMAELLSEKILHRQLTTDEKKKAGPIVHYAYGGLAGGFYGVAAEVIPAAKRGFGTYYATALFLGGDEIGVAALGLAKSPLSYPLSSHVNALGAHLVYGISTEMGRRMVRAFL
jgi:putative membrane protein